MQEQSLSATVHSTTAQHVNQAQTQNSHASSHEEIQEKQNMIFIYFFFFSFK